MAELKDLRDHLQRYRAVTLQCLDLVTDDDLRWRPAPDHLSLGQQFLHIAQSEDFQIQAHLNRDWDYERARFPDRKLTVVEVRAALEETRSRTMAALDELTEERLAEPVDHGTGQPVQTLR